MRLISGLFSPLYYLYDLCAFEYRNKFLAPLLRKVRLGLVWIDVLAKEKFANLSKKFILLFSFVSNLYLVYFIFFLYFVFLF